MLAVIPVRHFGVVLDCGAVVGDFGSPSPGDCKDELDVCSEESALALLSVFASWFWQERTVTAVGMVYYY